MVWCKAETTLHTNDVQSTLLRSDAVGGAPFAMLLRLSFSFDAKRQWIYMLNEGSESDGANPNGFIGIPFQSTSMVGHLVKSHCDKSARLSSFAKYYHTMMKYVNLDSGDIRSFNILGIWFEYQVASFVFCYDGVALLDFQFGFFWFKPNVQFSSFDCSGVTPLTPMIV